MVKFPDFSAAITITIIINKRLSFPNFQHQQQQQLTSQGVLMIPLLIMNEAAVISANPTILGFSGSHHGSGISSESLSYSDSDPDEPSLLSSIFSIGADGIFFSNELIFRFSLSSEVSRIEEEK